MSESPAKLHPPPAWRLWDNPIFRRYLRSRLRMKGLLPQLLLVVIFAIFFSLITPILSERADEGRHRARAALEERARLDPQAREWLEQQQQWDAQAGRSREKMKPEMFQRMALLPLLAIQALILFVVGTGQVAAGMTGERDDGMVDYQRLAPMTPLAKTLGYLAGLPVREWVLFASTLPFSALALWRGKVPFADWGPVAVIFFTSVILYHLTGLVTGTVMKNRRWAFLLCMGMIFLLYFLVPQGSRFGLPFLRYVTMWPALMETTHLIPKEIARDLRMFASHTPGTGVDFFHWNFKDFTFTLIVQGSFILTMLVMVWRRWRQADSHLMSKLWALLVFIWLCILPLGNALPGIQDGSLFPARNLRRYLQEGVDQPTLAEAIPMCGFYGLMMMLLLIVLVIQLTPSADTQARGLRRAAKLGKTHAPFLADASSAFTVVLLLTACAAASWSWFTHSVLSSHWFKAAPGTWLFPIFLGILAPFTLGLHALLEMRGGKWPFLAILFLGVVPMLAALVVLASSRGELPSAAVIVGGASPMVQPFYAAEQVVPRFLSGKTSTTFHDSARMALFIWPLIYASATLIGMIALRRHWKRMRRADAAPEPKLLTI
jgi:hypothetical protein